MGLSTGRQVHACKRAVDCDVQARHVDLCKMHVDLLWAMHSGHDARVDNRQIELGCKNAVNAALRSAGVYQGLDAIHPRRRRGRLGKDVRRVETDINEKGWSVGGEKVRARCAT